MPRLGELTSRLLLQQASRTPDGAGGDTMVWTTVATPWGKVVQTGGGEQLEGGQDPSRREFEITIRRRTGLTSALRVCWGAMVMSVTSVRQDDTDREFSVLECTEDPGADR